MLVIPVTVDAGPEPTYEEKMRVPPTLGGSVAECRTRDGLQVRVSPAPLCCGLEQDALLYPCLVQDPS